MRRRGGIAALAVCVSLLVPVRWVVAENRCNVTAHNLLSKVKSWSDLHGWFKGYADCNDGNLTDDVAEHVTSSLAKDWKDFLQLEQEIKKEPRFKEFVLSHIDSTTSIDDLDAVKKNAEQHCPAGSAPLCAEVAAAAQNALDGIKQAQ